MGRGILLLPLCQSPYKDFRVIFAMQTRFCAAVISLTVVSPSFAANLAVTETITTTKTVGGGDWYQLGGGNVASINSGGTLDLSGPAFESIIGQSGGGTLNINSGGAVTSTGATAGGIRFWIGNAAAGVGTVNLFDGGSFNGGSFTDFRLGRDNGSGIFNILGGTATIGDSTILFDRNNTDTANGTGTSYFNFSIGSTGSLTVTGATAATYEGWFTNGDLRHGGVNTGNFADHFAVTGSTLTAVPEPSAALLGLLGGLALRRQRRA